MSGRSRSTAATRAPQRISDGSGPISEPAPSTTIVRPSSRSHSGLSSTSPMASATEGSTTPASTHFSIRRRMPGPRSRSPRYGSTSSSTALAVADDLDAVQLQPRLGPVGQRHVLDARRPRAADRPARRDRRGRCRRVPAARPARPRPAGGSARGTRERQFDSPSAARAPVGSTVLSASATTLRPTAEVLRLPSASAAKTTPCCSSPVTGSSCPKWATWREALMPPSGRTAAATASRACAPRAASGRTRCRR